jgi:putative heme degradation protein
MAACDCQSRCSKNGKWNSLELHDDKTDQSIELFMKRKTGQRSEKWFIVTNLIGC